MDGMHFTGLKTDEHYKSNTDALGLIISNTEDVQAKLDILGKLIEG